MCNERFFFESVRILEQMVKSLYLAIMADISFIR